MAISFTNSSERSPKFFSCPRFYLWNFIKGELKICHNWTLLRECTYANACPIVWLFVNNVRLARRETSIWFYLSSVGADKVEQKYSIWFTGCNCRKIHSTQWWVIKQMKQDPSAACTTVATWPTSVEWRNADSYLMEDMAWGQDKSSWHTNLCYSL